MSFDVLEGKILSDEKHVRYPEEVDIFRSTYPGLVVQKVFAEGEKDMSGVQYLLRYESLGPNRDQSTEQQPPHSTLELISFN